MEHKELPKKQLSKKRFIPLLIFFVIGIILIPFKDSTPKIIHACTELLETKYRGSIINFSGILIGFSHFYYVGRHNEKLSTGFMRILLGLFTSIGTALGYAFMMNKGLDFAIGVLNEFFGIKPFFVCQDKIDYFSLSLVTIFIVFIAAYLLWKMAEESLSEIAQPSTDAEAAPANEKSQKKDV
jgi:flagellar biosynthesis protein FlhB